MTEEIRSILGNLDLREEAETEVKALVAKGQLDTAGAIAIENGFDEEWLKGLIDVETKARAKRIREQELERQKAESKPTRSSFAEMRRQRDATFAASQKREAEELAEKQRLFEANLREQQRAPEPRKLPTIRRE